MKKIGFIDLYLDEWHANNYPAWFRGAALGGEFELGGAWEKRPGARPLDVWCKEMDIPAYTSMEKLLEECDAFCVLAPSNPEVHEELAELPLMTGKPVYIAVEPFLSFYPAEEEHQDYYLKHPEEFRQELIDSGRIKA